MLNPFIRALEDGGPFPDAARAALQHLNVSKKYIEPGQMLKGGVALVVENGLLCSYSTVANGRRAILGLHLPGDCHGLGGDLVESEACVAALCASNILLADSADLHRLCADYSVATRALWRHTLVQGEMTRQWLVNLGQRDACSRTAHLFCELLWRYEKAGYVQNGAFTLPLTQSDLADALGLSVVHLNRVLKQLRASDLVELERKRLRVLDRRRLEELASFDPDYLIKVSVCDPQGWVVSKAQFSN